MGQEKINLRTVSRILIGRFELTLSYWDEEKHQTLYVYGRNELYDGGLDILCEQLGLSLNSPVFMLAAGRDSTVELYVSPTEAVCDRAYQLLLAGELEGSVGDYRPRGGDTDAAGKDRAFC